MLITLVRKLFRPQPDHREVAAMPIPAEKLRALTDRDQFLISYPRSGNTWMRYLIHDLLKRANPTLEPPEEPRGSLVPDVHQHVIDLPLFAQFGMKGRIMKSHNVRDLTGRRFVYIARSPVDSLVSYYHYHLRFDSLKHLAAGGVDEFAMSMVDGWCRHVELGYQGFRKNSDNVLIVTYENLLGRGVDELERVARFLDVPFTAETLQAAIETNAFAKLRAMEEIKTLNPIANREEFFFRKGKVNGGLDELNPEIAVKIEKRTADLMARINSAATHIPGQR